MNQKPTNRAAPAFNDPEKADGAPHASLGRVARAEGKRYGVLEAVIYTLFMVCAVCPLWWAVQEWAALLPQLPAAMEATAGTFRDDS